MRRDLRHAFGIEPFAPNGVRGEHFQKITVEATEACLDLLRPC